MTVEYVDRKEIANKEIARKPCIKALTKKQQAIIGTGVQIEKMQMQDEYLREQRKHLGKQRTQSEQLLQVLASIRK